MSSTDSEKFGLSIVEFCKGAGISRSLYYELEKEGRAPNSIKIGRRRIIPTCEKDKWVQRMLQEGANND